MAEHRSFVYPPVEVFLKLTPSQKQEFVAVLKKHLHVPIREDTGDHLQSSELQRTRSSPD